MQSKAGCKASVVAAGLLLLLEEAGSSWFKLVLVSLFCKAIKNPQAVLNRNSLSIYGK